MLARIAQGSTLRVPLRVFSDRDTPSDETGATLTLTISKNGATFDTPHSGDSPVEIGFGWYYHDLDATDTDTVGPLVLRAIGLHLDVCEPPPLRVVPGGGGSGNGATPEEVKAQVVEALSVDTYPETPQEVPGATVSLAYRLRWLYKLARN